MENRIHEVIWRLFSSCSYMPLTKRMLFWIAFFTCEEKTMNGRTIVREDCDFCLFVREMKDRGGRRIERILVWLRRRRPFHRLSISFPPFSLVGWTSGMYLLREQQLFRFGLTASFVRRSCSMDERTYTTLVVLYRTDLTQKRRVQ